MPNILVIDDDDANRTGMALVLAQHGYGIQVAEDGKTAIENIEKNSEQRFDLVIVDLMMPDMDGIEVYRKIKEKSVQTRFFATTAFPYTPVAKEARRLNLEIMEKPFGSQELIEKVRETLELEVISDQVIR